jgi:hypothetical protein
MHLWDLTVDQRSITCLEERKGESKVGVGEQDRGRGRLRLGPMMGACRSDEAGQPRAGIVHDWHASWPEGGHLPGPAPQGRRRAVRIIVVSSRAGAGWVSAAAAPRVTSRGFVQTWRGPGRRAGPGAAAKTRLPAHLTSHRLARPLPTNFIPSRDGGTLNTERNSRCFIHLQCVKS